LAHSGPNRPLRSKNLPLIRHSGTAFGRTAGTYTATYTNPSEVTSTLAFVIAFAALTLVPMFATLFLRQRVFFHQAIRQPKPFHLEYELTSRS